MPLKEKVFKAKPSSKPFTRGLVQVFTGDGKGKTSAALGTAVRALGQGLRVCLVFFMKGDYPYGERNILKDLPHLKVAAFGQLDFVDPANPKPEHIEEVRKALTFSREAMLSGEYDMVVMDEVNVAVGFKMLPVEDVIKLIQDKPKNVELILTGRRANEKIVQLADLVTEMVKIKHPYDNGVPARRGIDY